MWHATLRWSFSNRCKIKIPRIDTSLSSGTKVIRAMVIFLYNLFLCITSRIKTQDILFTLSKCRKLYLLYIYEGIYIALSPLTCTSHVCITSTLFSACSSLPCEKSIAFDISTLSLVTTTMMMMMTMTS